jgi:hypothetical protein
MITVYVKSSVAVKGLAHIPDVAKYTGKIVPNPKWLDDDHIYMTTGEDWFPFRVIAKKNIVSSSVPIDRKAPKIDKVVFKVKGSKDKIYTVTRENAIWSCTCVGFGFRHDCKHIMAAKKLLNTKK